MEGVDRAPPSRLGRLMPIWDWLPRYDRGALRGDVLAGIAVAAMIVPKDLGYADIAGVPVQNGLYAAAAGAIVYALFCTSRHISTGPSSSLAAVAGGAVLVAGVEGPADGRARGGDHARDGRRCSSCWRCCASAGSRGSSPGPSSRASWREPRSTSSSASCRS